MIPLGSSTRQRHIPVSVLLLIGLNLASFALEVRASEESLTALIERYGLIPARFFAHQEADASIALAAFVPLLSSAFLHTGLLHLAINLLFLWIFGGKVEDRMGHAVFLVFFLVGAAAAGLAHVASQPTSVIPTLGASGAIAAVMGAFLVLHPGARIRSAIPPFFWLQFPVPAILYLLFWFGLQLYMGSLPAEDASSSVAWWAHAGGFIFGVAWTALFGRRDQPA